MIQRSAPAQPHARRRSGLLPDEPVLPIQRRVAERVGDVGAHLLHQLDYYLGIYGQFEDYRPDDRPWVLATYDDWHDDFTWWSKGTLIRAVRDLEKLGVIETVRIAGSRSAKWYTISYETFHALVDDQPEPERRARGLVRRVLNLRYRPEPKARAARALRNPESAGCADGTAQAEQTGVRNQRSPDCAPSADQTAQVAHSVLIGGCRECEEREEIGIRAAAAQARAREGVAPERAAPEPAAAAGAGAGAAEAMPPPPAPPSPGLAKATAALVAAGFERDDAARLAVETDATDTWVEWLHRKAAKAATRRPGCVSVRGYIVQGLRRRWQPEDPSAAGPPGPPSQAQRAAQEQAQRTAEHRRSIAEAAERIQAGLAEVDREIAGLSGEQLDAIWTEMLPEVPDDIRRSAVKHGGPRGSRAARCAIFVELDRRKRLHACPPTAAAGAAAPRAPSPAGEEGTPHPERR